MEFCPSCGEKTEQRKPDDDNRIRAICSACDTIHYQNPKIVTGTLPIWGDKVLLCKRAIEPRYGTWTLPAGFMENGESVEQGALRETFEEAGAELDNLKLYTMLSIPRISQVYMLFTGKMRGEDAFESGVESLETKLFSEDDIPWDDIAFPMIERTLRYYFADRRKGDFGVYVEDM
ncbi:MAG: NUDIX hydrolase [Arenicellales bacterium]